MGVASKCVSTPTLAILDPKTASRKLPLYLKDPKAHFNSCMGIRSSDLFLASLLRFTSIL
jgi:hypothetical protein